MKSNARALASRMLGRTKRGATELNRAARVIAPVLEAESKRVLQAMVYNIPIPKSAKGKPLWTRSANLKRQETAHADGVDVVMQNDAAYALFRYQLGLPGHREPKYTLSVQWHAEALKRKRDFIFRERRAAVLRVLRG